MTTTLGGNAANALVRYVERIERLEEEKGALGDDIREIFAEVKAEGFDVKILRQAIKLRKVHSDIRAEHDAVLDLYMTALDRAEQKQVEKSLEEGT